MFINSGNGRRLYDGMIHQSTYNTALELSMGHQSARVVCMNGAVDIVRLGEAHGEKYFKYSDSVCLRPIAQITSKILAHLIEHINSMHVPVVQNNH